MDKLKQQIEQRLKANVLIDKCTHCDGIIFSDSWCSQDRVIRFTTPYFRELFSYAESTKGQWETGDYVMYEINNSEDSFVINCVCSAYSVSYALNDVHDKLLKVCGVYAEGTASPVVLKSWDYSSITDVNKLFDAFDGFLADEIAAFEAEIKTQIDTADNPLFREGAETDFSSNRYERNPKARAACIAAHGTACAVCGIDFGKEYGPEFAGKIEVHHIVPLSQIGREYVVDPVKDLVPVCPNCHTALHSKKGGVYTVSELKALRIEIKNNGY